jgi:ubiquinone/menaquinone biosynthesis C-methylase UbiE
MAGGGYGHANYGQFSRWSDTSDITGEQARELAARLELRAESEDQADARAAYLDLLQIAPDDRVLDVGCGSGAVARDVARRLDAGGTVVGLDPSQTLLDVAHSLASREGLAERIEFRVGDARALPTADADFDVALAATVLSHVPDGERAVAEMARAVRPGGRVGVFDLDGDSFVISHPDRDLTRRIVAAWSDHAIVDSWLGRRLPGLMTEVGLEDVRVRAFTPLESGPSAFYATLAERAAELAVRVEVITAEEHRRWLDAFHAEQAAGRSVTGLTHLFVWARRPLVVIVATDAEALAIETTELSLDPPTEAVAPPEERLIPIAPLETEKV